MRLFHYWRSSASWRVRWALSVKGIAFEKVAVNIVDGKQKGDEHRARNPIGHVPALEVSPGKFLAESVAIIEWLEETHPTPALFPSDPWAKARVRQVVELVNSGIQPLQNLIVLAKVSADPAAQRQWAHEFNLRGIAGLERLLLSIDAELGEGSFAVGNTLTAADLFVVPQVGAARRFGVTMEDYPRTLRAFESAMATEHALASTPEQQPDAPKS